MSENVISKQLQLNLYKVARNYYQTVRTEKYTHPQWILSHLVHGEIEVVTGGESYLAKSGDLMLHPANQSYSKYANTAGVREYLVFDATFWSHIDVFRFYPVATVLPLNKPQAFSTLFQLLLEAWEGKGQWRDLQLFALTLNLFSLVLDSWYEAGCPPRSTALASTQDRFMPVISYMAEHLGRKVSRDELANLIHLNPRYFDRVFFETYGKAPTEMLREMRLHKAIRLLENSKASLSEIANACGFKESAYFNRVFQAHFRQTPGKYRKNAQKDF